MTRDETLTLPQTVRTESGWLTALRAAFVLMLLCGAVYPLVAVWIGGLAFPYQSTGSLIERDGRVVGSELIGQPFAGPGWFQGRPSAAGTGYDPFAASGSNRAPSNPALRERAQAASKAIADAHGVAPSAIPSELIAASGSGLDPHIGPESALLQVPRVATARQLPEARVRELVEGLIEPPTLGVLGQPRVNVLKLNLALDALAARGVVHGP